MSRIGAIAKRKLIDFGLYRPARKLINFVRRDVARENTARKEFYDELIRSSDLVFDVGANIGDYTETFLSLGARVVAVEPQPSCVRELVARFGASAIVEALAVGPTQGSGELYLYERDEIGSLIKDRILGQKSIGAVRVPITTLDALIAKHGTPSYIKMDVEGYELAAIKGLTSPVKLISFEYNQNSDADIAEKREILLLLRNKGAKEAAALTFRHETWTVPWTDLTTFISEFPANLPRTPHFGDIFVTLHAPRARRMPRGDRQIGCPNP